VGGAIEGLYERSECGKAAPIPNQREIPRPGLDDSPTATRHRVAQLRTLGEGNFVLDTADADDVFGELEDLREDHQEADDTDTPNGRA
jgi:hypothetical protein